MKADVTAGLSLGEYCAIAISGGMYDREAVYAVRKRGILMEQAVPGGEGRWLPCWACLPIRWNMC